MFRRKKETVEEIMEREKEEAEQKVERRKRAFERKEMGKDTRVAFYNGTFGIIKGIFWPLMMATLWVIVFWSIGMGLYHALKDENNKTKNTIAIVLLVIFAIIGSVPFLGILIESAFRSFGLMTGINLANYAFSQI